MVLDCIFYSLVVALCLGLFFDDMGVFLMLWMLVSIAILLIALLSILLTYIVSFILGWPIDDFFWEEALLLLKFLLLFVFYMFLFFPV